MIYACVCVARARAHVRVRMCACACARAHVHDHVLHVRAKSARMVRMISMRIGRLLLLQLLLLGEQRLDRAADVASPRLGLGLVCPAPSGLVVIHIT